MGRAITPIPSQEVEKLNLEHLKSTIKGSEILSQFRNVLPSLPTDPAFTCGFGRYLSQKYGRGRNGLRVAVDIEAFQSEEIHSNICTPVSSCPPSPLREDAIPYTSTNPTANIFHQIQMRLDSLCLDPVQDPTTKEEPISESALVSCPWEVDILGDYRDCNGLGKLEYIQYALHKWGPVVMKNDDPCSTVGIATRDHRENVNYYAINCELSPKGKMKRCPPCNEMALLVKSRARAGLSSLPSNISALQKMIVELRTKVTDLETDLEKSRTRILELETKVLLKDAQPKLNTTVELDPKSEAYMLSLVKRLLLENPQYRETFNYKLVLSQLEVALFKKKHKWDPAIIQWALTLEYYGSQRVIDIARGIPLKKGEKINVANIALHLPSKSTLKCYVPVVDPYEEISTAKLDVLKPMVQSNNDGGLVFDGFEIKKQLSIDRNKDLIVGCTSPIKIGDLSLNNFYPQLEAHTADMAAEVIQVFYVGTSSRVAFPLGFFPVLKNSKRTADLIIGAIDTLKSHGINITWTSSDGFSGSFDYEAKIKSKSLTVNHFYDYEHLLKNARNALLNANIDCPKTKTSFSLKSLIKASHTHPLLKGAFKKDWLHPVDKMAIGPVLGLFSGYTKLEGIPELSGLCKFCEMMYTFYCIMSKNVGCTVELAQKRAQMNTLEAYIKELQYANPSKIAINQLCRRVRTTYIL
jgi:hypothetical protein